MRTGLIFRTIAIVLCCKAAFAMEAFEQGNQEEIGRICAQKIQQFQHNPEVVEKFIMLQSCLGDCFWNSVSDGSYEQAFKAIRPYLGEVKEEGAAADGRARILQTEMGDTVFSLRDMNLAASGSLSKKFLGTLDKIRENPALEGMKSQIMPIWRHLESLPNMMDVHVLDAYVGANLKNVIEIGKTLRIGNPDLSFEDVHVNMKRYFQENPITLKLNGEVIPQATFLGYVDNVFQADFKSQGALFQELVSRSWSFAIEVRTEKYHHTGKFEDGFLTELASGIVENYVTGEGCLEERVNRFFAAYVRMIYDAIHRAQ
ncbi:MAG: hypothetical protein JSS34_02155 [Proteobacteria bacterium]|nr:hypothetical protein [Pseudomonadota bacterium]